jgi:GNAT superfamily N-acetyltransferase
MQLSLIDLRLPHPDWDGLEADAEREGHAFVRRTRIEWNEGRNQFEHPGECFSGAFVDNGLVGIGGLNIDPYAGRATVGRLRHVYVRPEARRLGVGMAIVTRAIEHAKSAGFEPLRLRTKNPDAADFYEAIGFSTIKDAFATHMLILK